VGACSGAQRQAFRWAGDMAHNIECTYRATPCLVRDLGHVSPFPVIGTNTVSPGAGVPCALVRFPFPVSLPTVSGRGLTGGLRAGIDRGSPGGD